VGTGQEQGAELRDRAALPACFVALQNDAIVMRSAGPVKLFIASQ
jgi:hypothetical protein